MPLGLNISRLPLVIFLLLVLGSLAVGFATIYEIVATNSRGEYLHFENEIIKMNFPKNWVGISWEEKNLTSGTKYGIFLAPPQMISTVLFRIHSEQATRYFMKEHNLTDASSVVSFEINRMYNYSLTKNENASIISRESGEVIVSGNKANYSKIIIKDGIIYNGVYYNMTFLIISYIENQKLVQIAFLGKKEDCEKSSDLFKAILNSTEIRV